MSRPLTLAAAVVIGVALVFAEPFEYRCAATLRITGEPDPRHLGLYRAELLNHSWQAGQTAGAEDTTAERWSADFPAPDLLRLLCLTAKGRQTGLERIRTVAEAYRVKMASLRAAARTTPSEAEVTLSEYASRLRSRLDEIGRQLESVRASPPPTDPQEQRETLLNRWESLRSTFASARRQLGEAAAEVNRLRSEPEPTHGIVPAGERRRALEADLVLQQDLRELEVKLSEVKLHLLNVWQASAERLERLQQAANELADHTPPESTLRAVGEVRQTVEDLLAEARQYRDALLAFGEAWTREFNTLRHVAVDPLSGELLDTHERVRTLLNDHLFRAGKRLATVRALVSRIGDESGDHARYYVLQSDLTRGFQTVQTAHHRFEFAAGALEASDNFRLDSALRSARGLRRRSQHRIGLIEERLQAEAAELARRQRKRESAEAGQLVERLREGVDQTVEELILLQEELTANADRWEVFLLAGVQHDLIVSRYEQAKEDLAEVQQRLHNLAAQRMAEPDEARLELVSAEVLGGPTNLQRRCRAGGIGAAVTLLVLSLVQWQITRRLR